MVPAGTRRRVVAAVTGAPTSPNGPSGGESTSPRGIHENDASTTSGTSPAAGWAARTGSLHHGCLHHLAGGDPYGGLVGLSAHGDLGTGPASELRDVVGVVADLRAADHLHLRDRDRHRADGAGQRVGRRRGVWDTKVSVISRVRTGGRSTTPSAPISPDAVRSLSA